jgi:hypothetical protein
MGSASARRRGVSTTVVDASDTAKANVPIIRRKLFFEISPIVRAARGRIAPAVLVSVHFIALVVPRSRKKDQAHLQNHQQRRDLTTLL